MTEKELDKILTSVLGKKPDVTAKEKPQKRGEGKTAEAKKQEKKRLKTTNPMNMFPAPPVQPWQTYSKALTLLSSQTITTLNNLNL